MGAMQRMQMIHANPNEMNAAVTAQGMNPVMVENREPGVATASVANVQQNMVNQQISNIASNGTAATAPNVNNISIKGAEIYSHSQNHAHFINSQLPKHAKTEIASNVILKK